MKKKILVAGSLNMDMVIDVNQMPLKGETILGSGLTYIPGGKGANQVYAIARLDGDVTMLGSVGDDNFGNIQRENLSSKGADTSAIRISTENPTGTAVIYVDGDGNNCIVVVPGANSDCDTEYLKANDDAFQACDYALFQMEIPREAVFYGIRRAKELGRTVILNPAPAPDHLPDDILNKIDYITPNETELMKLTGIDSMEQPELEKGARILLDKGIANVLVTLGDKGAMLVNKDGCSIYPTRKVNAVDTTAAGDCFNGAFVTALSEGWDEGRAIRFANAASSIAVTEYGAQTSIPDRAAAERLFNAEEEAPCGCTYKPYGKKEEI